LADASWVYRQYDHQLFLNTVVAPGADAALLRLAAPGVPRAAAEPLRGLALSTDGNSRWCSLDPKVGTALVVAESTLNVACVGARPVAVVNCLNFGNPEHPEVMWQLSEAIDGMAGACRDLSIPVIGGNVSLYNESRGRDIDPTPVVGTLGIVDHLLRRPPGAGLVDGGRMLLVGAGLRPGDAPTTSLAGSRWAVERRGHRGGRLPALDAELHGRLLRLVCELVGGSDELVEGVHDVSGGGVGVALAEMAVTSQVGFRLSGIADHAALFGEGPSRVLLCVPGPSQSEVQARITAADLGYVDLGAAGGDRLVVEGLVDVALEDAIRAWRDALPHALGLPPAADLGGSG
jgi:phosphoribosylformylglycinamidine synthase